MTKSDMDHPIYRPEKEGFETPVRPDTTEPQKPLAPQRGRRRFPFVGTALTLLIIGGLGFGAYSYLMHEPKIAKQSGGRFGGNGAQSVGVATIGRGDITVEIQALGTVTPLANITIKTQISGYLTEVGFTEGQIVKKGDFLAQIDQRPYEALEHQYEGQLLHDQGVLNQAQYDLVRYQTLMKQDSIAKQTAEDQQFIVEQAKGTVRSDQALIETQKLNIAYCHIVAPADGRVGLRQVDPGNYVQTTDTNGLVVLTQLQPISVIFSVPENSVPKLVAAMKTNPQLEAEAYEQSDMEKLASGHLASLDNVIDTTTGMLKARALFENSDNNLFTNQFVNIHLKIGQLHNVLTIPTAAVQRGSPGTFAYVVGTDNKVSVRKITLGPSQGSMTAVTAGLDQGESVVIEGSDRLRDGASVIVPSNAALYGSEPATPKPERRTRDKQ